LLANTRLSATSARLASPQPVSCDIKFDGLSFEHFRERVFGLARTSFFGNVLLSPSSSRRPPLSSPRTFAFSSSFPSLSRHPLNPLSPLRGVSAELTSHLPPHRPIFLLVPNVSPFEIVFFFYRQIMRRFRRANL